MAFRTRFIGSLASLGFAAALVAGCGTTLMLNNDRLQQVLVSGLQDNGISATVTCPDNQPIQQGAVFLCQATTQDGATLTIQVTQTDNNGNVDWKVIGS